MSKKLIALLLVLASVLSVFAGCSNNAPAATEPEAPVNAEPTPTEATVFDPRSITEGVKLTISAKELTWIADYNEVQLTKELEEVFGVEIEWITFPSADYESKLSIMASGGEKLPDIMFFPGKQYMTWAAEDLIVDLTPYFEDPNYSPYYHKAAEFDGFDIVGDMRDAEGKIYGLPLKEGGIYNATILNMNKEWLDELGLEVPKTVEDFYNVAKAMAGKDLNGNGIADEMLFTGCNSNNGLKWLNVLMSAFVYSHDSRYLVVDDGKLSFAFNTDAWKEGLKYINRFFDEGLITTDILTQDGNQMWAQWLTEEPSCFALAYVGTYNMTAENAAKYVQVPALYNDDGYGYSDSLKAYANPEKPGAVISADCENPDAAFLVMDYLYKQEVSISQQFGKQGVHWDYWEDVDPAEKEKYYSLVPGEEPFVVTYGEKWWSNARDGLEPDGLGVQTISYYRNCPAIIPYAMERIAKEGTGDTSDPVVQRDIADVQRKVDALEAQREEYITSLPMTTEENARAAELFNTIKTYVNQSRAEFVTGQKDIDAEWDAYINELKKMGVDELLALYQTAYDRTK